MAAGTIGTPRRSVASSVPGKMTPELWSLVEDHLAEGWSPEQVSRRLVIRWRPVEVDETCVGGRRRNMSNAKRADAARWT